MTRTAIAAALAVMLAGGVGAADPTPTAQGLIAGDTKLWSVFYAAGGYPPPSAPLRWVEKHATVYIDGTAGRADREDLDRAVGILNEYLPAGRSVSVGRGPTPGPDRETGQLEPGVILIGFGPKFLWPKALTEGPFSMVIGGGHPDIVALGMPLTTSGPRAHHIRGGFILVDSDDIRQTGGSVVRAILHEFLHVTGRMHPHGPLKHALSIMNHDAPARPPTFLHPLDIEILQTMFGRTEP